MKVLIIYFIFFVTLFNQLIVDLHVPRYFSISIELCIIILFVLSVLTSKRAYIPHLWYCLFFFLLIGFCSVAVNGTRVTYFIFSLRVLLRFYFFYLALTLLSLDDQRIKKINNFVVALLLLQLPVVAVKFSIYGIAEKTMGAYTMSGAVTTMLPIGFIFYLAGYYLLYSPKRRYILIGFGFVLFSIVGAKRAVAFLYPVQFLAIYYYIYKKEKVASLPKNVGAIIVSLSLILVVSGSIFYLNPTLNPEREVGGSVDPLYALEFAKEYTTKEHVYGYTSGRVSTTIRILNALWDSGIGNVCFGFGPGSTTPSILDAGKSRANIEKFFEKLKIAYGVTSMTRIALEYGMFGVAAYILIPLVLARMCWRYYKRESDAYWKAFAAGSVGFSFSMLFFFFAYSHGAFWGDTMPPLYFYAMAVIYTRSRRVSNIITKQEPALSCSF